MPVVESPTFAAILERIGTDVEARTDSAFFAASVERFLAVGMAKVSRTNHDHADSLISELLPTTCGRDMLLAWADALDIDVQRPTPAIRRAYFAGTNGTILPLGTEVQGPDNVLFTVTTAGTVTLSEAYVTLTAVEPGPEGNLAPLTQLNLVTPIPGLLGNGLIFNDPAINVDGTDDEAREALRRRVVLRLRSTPSGGGPGDYVQWALEVPGVTRAWEFGNRMSAGTVSLAFVRDDDSGSIIPSAAEVAEVQTYIEARWPIDARALYVAAPVAREVPMTIAISPNTAAVQAAVLTQLADLFRSETGVEEATPPRSRIDEYISVAEGESDHRITLLNGEAADGWDPDPGTFGINVLGTVTFTGL